MSERCSICREWVFFTPHVCKPAFECRFAKGGPIYVDDDQEWETVHGIDAETAAEKFCERYDSDGGEYIVLTCGERNPPTVEVRPQGKEEVQKFRVIGESEPVYRGELVT
jgi:hypothetical protein